MPLESGISDYLAEAIFEFNKTDSEYLIRIWDKYKTGLTIGRSIGSPVDEAEQKEALLYIPTGFLLGELARRLEEYDTATAGIAGIIDNMKIYHKE